MKWLSHWRFRRTTLAFVFCLAFLIGAGLSAKVHVADVSWALLFGGVVLVLGRRRSLATMTLIILFGLSLGLWRGSVYAAKLSDYDHYFYRSVTISAVADNDAAYDQHKQLSFDAHDVYVNGHQLTGKVGISGFGVPAVYAGDHVEVAGKLYPGHGSYQAKISFATIKLMKSSDSLVANLRRRFASGMQTALPEPLASFGMGLLIGQKANLPPEVYQSLLMVGLVHIIAVSGYNLTIILRASNGLLSKQSKRLSTLLALSLIGLFLLFAGDSASIVRAAIVSVLTIVAGYYGRQFKPLLLIMLAAAITAWLKPFYVWTDVSWYLSFLAFFGVMVLAPQIISRLPSRLQNSLVMTVALESLCAELMTLPYVLYIFGQMSFIGLVANVLVVALVPLAMLLCMVAGLAGMLLPAIAGWFAWPARLLLTYMLDIANLLSRIPHIFVQNLGFSLSQLLLAYGSLCLVAGVLWHKTKRFKFAKITDENTARQL